MLKTAATAASRGRAAPVTQEHFERIIQAIWWKSRHRPKLGLAISGGVDSMALAALCSRFQSRSRGGPSFTAFVVDHRLRQGSADEANAVVHDLKALKLKAHVLTLDWSTSNPAKHSNIETLARERRFQALGKACRDAGIDNLMLAHHANDQAETVMSRLIMGYVGSGLQGIQEYGRIPECKGIYGVAESGEHRLLPAVAKLSGSGGRPTRILVEDGGVHIHRPLLEMTKAQLIETCNEANVQWHEDATNKDLDLTLRNAIRHLLGNYRLPAAIDTTGLRTCAQRVYQWQQSRTEAVDRIFEACKIQLDVCSGLSRVTYPIDVQELLESHNARATELERLQETRYRAALLIRRIVMLTSPQDGVSIDSLEQTVKCTFPWLWPDTRHNPELAVSIANIIYRRTPLSLVPVNDPRTVSKQNHPTHDDRRLLYGAGSDLSSQHETADDEQLDDASKADDQVILTGTHSWSVERSNPAHNDPSAEGVTLLHPQDARQPGLDHVWSEWQLFDGRFWIRLVYRPYNQTPGHRIYVRFLTPDDLETLRREYKGKTNRGLSVLGKLLKLHAPGKARFTLPAIISSYEVAHPDGTNQVMEAVMALPSISWSLRGWHEWWADYADSDKNGWGWQIRYKRVDLEASSNHSVVSCIKPLV